MRSIFVFTALIALASCQTPTNTELPSDQELSDSLSVEESNQGLSIAFIYGDTINENYQFLIDVKEELEQEEKIIQERLERKLRKAEQRAAELQQQAPTMTQLQMQEAQLELQNLDLEMQRFQEKLMTDFRKREVDLQLEYIQRVDSFLDSYNSEGQYDFIMNYQPGGNLIWVNNAYDITDEVLEGLNSAYQDEMSQESIEQP